MDADLMASTQVHGLRCELDISMQDERIDRMDSQRNPLCPWPFNDKLLAGTANARALCIDVHDLPIRMRREETTWLRGRPFD
jgi:hypothetical protein